MDFFIVEDSHCGYMRGFPGGHWIFYSGYIDVMKVKDLF